MENDLQLKNMNKNLFQFKTIEEIEGEYERFNTRREAIFKRNELLIKKWRSMPWYKTPSFEEQRAIILSNWGIFTTKEYER